MNQQSEHKNTNETLKQHILFLSLSRAHKFSFHNSNILVISDEVR